MWIRVLGIGLIAASAARAQGADEPVPKYIEGRVEFSKALGLDAEAFYPVAVWDVKTPFDRTTPAQLARGFIFGGTYWGGLLNEAMSIQKQTSEHYAKMKSARVKRLVEGSYYDSLFAADTGSTETGLSATPTKAPVITEKALGDGEAEVTIRQEYKLKWQEKEIVGTDFKRLTCARKDGKWFVRKIETGTDKNQGKGEPNLAWKEELPPIQSGYWQVESDGPGPSFDPSTGSAKACAESYMFDLRLELRVVRDGEQRATIRNLVPLIDELFDPALLKAAREKARAQGSWEERLKKTYRPRTAQKEEDLGGDTKRFIFAADSFLSDAVALTVTKGKAGWRVTRIEKVEEKAEKKGTSVEMKPVFTPIKKWSQALELGLG